MEKWVLLGHKGPMVKVDHRDLRALKVLLVHLDRTGKEENRE